MEIKRFEVTGRLRFGPGDTILLDDEGQIKQLKRLGVIGREIEEPRMVRKTSPSPASKKEDD